MRGAVGASSTYALRMTSASSPRDDDGLTIRDEPERGRYEAWIGDELAGWVEYRALRGRLAAIHTEVLPAFGGRGVATRLVGHVVSDARSKGVGITPICPMFIAWFERHPEDAELVRTGREPRKAPTG